MQGIEDIDEDEPTWQGFEPIEVTRLKSAAEQLIHIQKRSSQRPYRNYAILMILLYTGLRQFELRGLNIDQLEDKHLVNIRRKGRKVTRRLLIPKPAREAMEEYIKRERGSEPGPLIQSRTGLRLTSQDLDAALKQIARQANVSLPPEQHIKLHAHKLRHTALKDAADKYDVRFALELSGHTSPHYIWRYTGHTQKERDEMMEGLH
jgi:integrase